MVGIRLATIIQTRSRYSTKPLIVCTFIVSIRSSRQSFELALEIENLLFPGSKASIVIENLLEKKLAEINNFLDRHGYPIVLGESAPTHINSPTQGELDKWKIPSDAPVEVEKTTNTGILPGANTPVSTIPPDVKIEPKVPPTEVVQEDPSKVDQPSTEKLPSETDETQISPILQSRLLQGEHAQWFPCFQMIMMIYRDAMA